LRLLHAIAVNVAASRDFIATRSAEALTHGHKYRVTPCHHLTGGSFVVQAVPVHGNLCHSGQVVALQGCLGGAQAIQTEGIPLVDHADPAEARAHQGLDAFA
jgi:hypothetical protein